MAIGLSRADRPAALFLDLGGMVVSGDDRGEGGSLGEGRLLPGVREAVDCLPGVPLFLVAKEAEVRAPAMEQLFAAVHAHLDGRITAARWCPHPPEAGCAGHKPEPGLVLDLAATHQVDPAGAWYVGDSLADEECARRAGIGQFHWAQTFFAPVRHWHGQIRVAPSSSSAAPTSPGTGGGGTAARSGAGPRARSGSTLRAPAPPTCGGYPVGGSELLPSIRRATEGDLPEIVRIYNEAIEERIATCDLEPATVEIRRPWFQRFDERHRLHVATAGDTVVGWSAILPYDPKAGYAGTAEHSIYVAREARGAGLGRRLLQHLIDSAVENGLRCLMGRIFRHNPRSLELHRRFGFQEVGVLPRVARLDGRPVDVVIMLRHLERGG